MRIERDGDDLVVRLPDELVEALQLREGDEVELRAAGPGCIEVFRVSGGKRLASFEAWSDPADDKAFRTL